MKKPRTYIKDVLILTEDDDHNQEIVRFSNDVSYGYAVAVEYLDDGSGAMMNLQEVDELIAFLERARQKARHKPRGR